MASAQQTLRLPNVSSGSNPTVDVLHRGQVVIVGANGSGKSRLGAWLENPQSLKSNRGMAGAQPRQAYRLGAQRVLALPDQAQRMDATRATEQLVRGSEGPGGEISRIQGDPVVGQNNDFALLINTLFAERAKLDREYRERGTATGGKPGAPKEDTLQRLKALWERIFSERGLIIGDHVVQAKPKTTEAAYPASALSDGERVGFYLAAHALLAPVNARLVIDEPELHLHQSIQSAMWDALEATREDCVFVYITHDLSFAASRTRATKVVLYDYTAPTNPDGVGSWRWDIVPETRSLPEDVVLRILGSRRPTLFVEGLTGSLDQEVYEALFPDRYIIPSGGCDAVDRSVRAFRKQVALHHLEVLGLIDRDDRTANEVEALQKKGIHVLPVAAVENLLALPECIRAYAIAVAVPEAEREDRTKDGERRVLDAMAKVRTETVAERAQYAVRRRLSHVSRKGHSMQDLIVAVEEATSAADPASAYAEAEAAIDDALNPANASRYHATLGVFRNKAVLAELASAFRVDASDYASRVIDVIRSDAALRAIIRRRLTLDS